MPRSDEQGKTSSVHFLPFPFTDTQISDFRTLRSQVMQGISHPNHTHLTVMQERIRQALAGDFDVSGIWLLEFVRLRWSRAREWENGASGHVLTDSLVKPQ